MVRGVPLGEHHDAGIGLPFRQARLAGGRNVPQIAERFGERRKRPHRAGLNEGAIVEVPDSMNVSRPPIISFTAAISPR